MLDAYESALKAVTLSGPTLFEPIIRLATSRVREPRFSFTADSQNYTMLLILTDGKVEDMIRTKNALVAAAREPISVVIVGVGDADFSSMEELDGDEVQVADEDGNECERDIVQFVPMREFTGPLWKQRLTASVLKEIPDQFLEFVQDRALRPGLVPTGVGKGAAILRSLSAVGTAAAAESKKQGEPDGAYPDMGPPPMYELTPSAPDDVCMSEM